MDIPSGLKQVVLQDIEDGEYVESHKFSPLGNRLLVQTEEVRDKSKLHSLCIYDATKGRFLKEVYAYNNAQSLLGYKWSPLGSFIMIRKSETAIIYSEDGKNLVHLDVPSWFGVKFSEDERQIYAADKVGVSILTVFNPKTGKKLAELPEGKLYAIDPLTKLITLSHKKTNFFSTETFEKVGEIDDSVRCYGQDGLIMGAWHWIGGDQGGHHSLYNRKFECVRTFEPVKGFGCFAVIAPNQESYIAYSAGREVIYDIATGDKKAQADHQDANHSRDFLSWDGTWLIKLHHEYTQSKELSFTSGFDVSTRIFITNLKDEALPIKEVIVFPEAIGSVLYTADPSIVLVGLKHILNLKTGQTITTNNRTQKQMSSERRRIKSLISGSGAYVDEVVDNGNTSIVVRQLDWNT